jgi:hypothetical protein
MNELITFYQNEPSQHGGGLPFGVLALSIGCHRDVFIWVGKKLLREKNHLRN